MEDEFINPSVSDHALILIEYRPHATLRTKSFKLLKTIMDHSDFKIVFAKVWHIRCRGSYMVQLWFKLKELNYALKDLNSFLASYEQ